MGIIFYNQTMKSGGQEYVGTPRNSGVKTQDLQVIQTYAEVSLKGPQLVNSE